MQKDIHDIHDQVRNDYRQILQHPEASLLTGNAEADTVSASVGYTPEELASVPPEANLGLGCGNPLRAAGLQPGEVVIDLGSGPGLDCFLAGRQVGPKGRVVGVDMTPEMLSTARETAKRHRIRNVEFRLGEIENLPAADNFADVCISNCVINMSPVKGRVYREIFRVLDCPRRIGLTLNESLLMSPSKSVTAVFGVTDRPEGDCAPGGCAACGKQDCIYRE